MSKNGRSHGLKVQPFARAGGYTVFENDIIDLVMPISRPNTWKVVCAVLRKTRGWIATDDANTDEHGRKLQDAISVRQLQSLTGIVSLGTLQVAIQDALDQGFILREQNPHHKQGFLYRLNRAFELEIKTSSKILDIQTVTDSVTVKTVTKSVTDSVTKSVTETVPKIVTTKQSQTNPNKDDDGLVILVTLESEPPRLNRRAVKVGGETGVILDDFGIKGTNRTLILKRGLEYKVVLAILLEIVAAGLRTGMAVRLLKQDEVQPSQRFLAWAELTPAAWTKLWEITEEGKRPPKDLRNHAREWGKDFRGVFECKPFTDQGPRRRAPKSRVSPIAELGLPSTPASVGPASIYHTPVLNLSDGKRVDGNTIWQTALGELQLQLTAATFDTWLSASRLLGCDETGGVYTVGLVSGYAKDWVEHRLDSMLKRTLYGIIGKQVQIKYVVFKPQVNPGLERKP